MEITSKRKDIIKNITIVFLIIMLVLTFFSSTIMNRSLPEVAAQYAYSGQITTSVRANGTTVANQNYKVIIEEGRVIQEIKVRRGDKVAVDDILFLLEDAESTEMQAALDKLSEAKLAYEKWKLQVETDLADKERNIRYENEDLAQIKAKGVNSTKVDTSEVEAEIKEYDKLLASYSLSEALLLFENAKKALAEAEAAYDAAELALDEKKDAEEKINDEYEEFKENSAEYEEILNELLAAEKAIATAEEALLPIERQIEDKTIAYDRAKAEYDELCATLTTAIEAREKLQKDLNLAKANSIDNSGNISIYKEEITYYSAEVARLSSLVSDLQVEVSNNQTSAVVNEILKEIEELNKQLNTIEADRDAKNVTASEAAVKLNDAKTAMDTAESAVAAAQKTLDDLNAANPKDNTAIADAQAALATAQSTFTAAKNDHAAAESDFNTKKAALDAAQDAWNTKNGEISIVRERLSTVQGTAGDAAQRLQVARDQLAGAQGQLSYYQSQLSNTQSNSSITDSNVQKAQSAFDANETKITQYEEQKLSMEQKLEDQTRELDRTKEDYESDVAAIEIQKKEYAEMKAATGAGDNLTGAETFTTALKDAQRAIRDAEEVLADAQEAVSEAKAEYNSAKSTYDTAKKNTKKDGGALSQAEIDVLIEETEQKRADAQDRLEAMQKEPGYTDGYGSYSAYRDAIVAQQRTIEGLEKELAQKKETNALEEPGYIEDIERAQKEVDRLSETVGGTEIKAKVSGTVNNIAVSAGQEVEAQTVLLEIEQQDQGYAVELNLSAEEAKRVSVGQAASILYYWGDTPEAVVASITPSKTDPQNKRVVTLQVSGNITAGQNFTFSLGERSANYDTVVPNSAIREDSSGKFVLVIEAKNTPIGNRYTAVRRDVEVIANDEVNTAISGLTGGEYVITTSETPISAGQQIRLSDN